MSDPITLDFETWAIQQRPAYPPRPVGVAIRWQDGRTQYLAWGHPSGNNTTMEAAREVLAGIWRSGEDLLFHNAKFDLDVAATHLGLPLPDWRRVHDTMFLLFLRDPHAKTLALKPSAEALLGLPPNERDAVRDWLVAHGYASRASKQWGAAICEAPGDLVGPYAVGDVDRTFALFKLLRGEIARRGMTPAYDRERELLPILLRNETAGMVVNRAQLAGDFQACTYAQGLAEGWLRLRLSVPEINFDADAELADALDRAGIVAEWDYTPKSGQRKVSKDSLTLDKYSDPEVFHALGYRNRMKTCLSTFMEPWLSMSEGCSRIYTSWNQVRQPGAGARTGRLSGSPNFMNIPKPMEDRSDGYLHPSFLGARAVPLPQLRRYILPDEPGSLIGHRDYSQQEIRILAHFIGGEFAARVSSDETFDAHTYMIQEIRDRFGLEVRRSDVKALTFGLLYGEGITALSVKLGLSLAEARQLRDAHSEVLGGLTEMNDNIKNYSRAGGCIATWGGREYFVEPPKVERGETRTFEYKLLNYLIQGSAADNTKQALINYDKARKHGRLMLTVHDEINISCPREHMQSELLILRDAMADVAFDVPMRSTAKVGPTWGDLKGVTECAS